MSPMRLSRRWKRSSGFPRATREKRRQQLTANRARAAIRIGAKMAGLGCIKRPHKWLKAKGKWLKVEGIFFAFPLALSLLPLAGFLLFQLPQPLRQGRDDLEQVADDAVGGHLEDRRFLVPVDGDDHVRVLHPDQVLDRPAYPAGDVYL